MSISIKRPATHIAYAYTVKALGLVTITPEDYKKFFDRLSNFGIEIEYKVGETGKQKKFHYHGILYLEKGFFRKKLCLQGYHLKLKPIYNKKGWLRYIHKDVKEKIKHIKKVPTEQDWNDFINWMMDHDKEVEPDSEEYIE